MFYHAGPNSSVVFAGCQILRDTDLQIPILKNEQQLKLKLHKLWITGGGGGGGVVWLNTVYPELVSISSCAFQIRP